MKLGDNGIIGEKTYLVGFLPFAIFGGYGIGLRSRKIAYGTAGRLYSSTFGKGETRGKVFYIFPSIYIEFYLSVLDYGLTNKQIAVDLTG